MADIGAAAPSTAGYNQFLAYQNLINIKLNKTIARKVMVKFGIGSLKSTGSTVIDLTIDAAEFHILKTNTSFLLSIGPKPI